MSEGGREADRPKTKWVILLIYEQYMGPEYVHGVWDLLFDSPTMLCVQFNGGSEKLGITRRCI